MRKLVAALATSVMLVTLLPAAGALDLGGTAAGDEDEREIYIVTLTDRPLATYEGGIGGLAPTAPHATGAQRLDPRAPASVAYLSYLATQQDAALGAIATVLGRIAEPGLRYDAVLNGFTLELTASEASIVAGLPMVTRVQPDEMLHLHTDAGPAWIGAPDVWSGDATADPERGQGEGVVVGVIDTGVNFQHPSFAEVGPVDGHVHDNPRGTFFGVCDPVTGAPFCNDKLIGMYDFTSVVPVVDDNGHGSHVASTVAGNHLDMSMVAPTISVDRSISGVAPHANLISYRACASVAEVGVGTCPLNGTLGSINQATLDQVDVVNFSIGGGPANPWTSLLALAFLNARSAGVFVATSAGNDGPGPATVGNPANAPWLFTVGASTHDRDFPNILADMERDGQPGPDDISGKGLTAGMDAPARVVYAGDFGNELCGSGTLATPINPFPPGTFDGEIVVCDRGTFARVDKARHVEEAGAGGFVLANDEESGDSLVADPYVLPGVHITFDDGIVVKDWIEEGGGADHQGTAIITGTLVDESPDNADVMASFSSRGPNAPAQGILKPDITAPGVDILAAWEGLRSPGDPEQYNVISGTSMSSPHAAGAAALVRAAQPEWTPDEVRAALMTTAFTEPPGTGDEVQSILKEDATTASDPFDRGAGRIDLRRAALAGLVLDETPDRYEAADPAQGGDPRSLNLPSFADADCEETCSWTRELRATADTPVTWTAAGTAGDGVQIAVEPAEFTLAPDETVVLTVTADVTDAPGACWQFGEVQLAPDEGTVPGAHLPVAVLPVADPCDLPDVDFLTLHFRGNLGDEFGCTGDGHVDLELCGGPFLLPDGDLSDAPAARWVDTSLLVGLQARTHGMANWEWQLEEPTSLQGPMALTWWASCEACNLALFDDWDVSLWADGEQVFEERVRTNMPLPEVPERLEATVELPPISASSSFVLNLQPVFVNQAVSTVYYDSTLPCPGAVEGPCDSFVEMPVVGEAVTVDLAITGVTPVEVPGRERRGGPRYRLIATVENLGEADADSSHTEFWLEGPGRDDLLGLVSTPGLPAGESVEVEVGFDTRGLRGDYVVTVTADALQVLPDATRDNNIGRLVASVQGNQIRDHRFEPGPG